jgi:hypothetical protein
LCTPVARRCEESAEAAFRYEGGRRGNLVLRHAVQTEIAVRDALTTQLGVGIIGMGAATEWNIL